MERRRETAALLSRCLAVSLSLCLSVSLSLCPSLSVALWLIQLYQAWLVRISKAEGNVRFVQRTIFHPVSLLAASDWRLRGMFCASSDHDAHQVGKRPSALSGRSPAGCRTGGKASPLIPERRDGACHSSAGGISAGELSTGVSGVADDAGV